MSEAKEYLVQPVEKGTVNISEEVVAAIAALAISDVEGVYGLSSSFTADLAELLGVGRDPDVDDILQEAIGDLSEKKKKTLMNLAIILHDYLPD